MTRKYSPLVSITGITLVLAALGAGALAAQDKAAADKYSVPGKYSVKVPNGLAFADFKGYEEWATIGVSETATTIEVIVGNPAMIGAYRAGVPGNGKPFPDGARMAKIHWSRNKNEHFPDTTVPGTLHDVDFMVKDAKKYADSGGWGYGVFKYDAASDTYMPGTVADKPPQANDAKCGFGCHTLVKARDYVFTEYGKR